MSKEDIKMSEKKKDKDKIREVPLDDLEQVTGGALDDVPRVPEHKIDNNLKNKI